LGFLSFSSPGGVDFGILGLFYGFDGVFSPLLGSTAPETVSFIEILAVSIR